MNKYESVAIQVLNTYPDVTIQYWKSNHPWSGKCYQKKRLIKSPRPISATSLNTLFHELGHLHDTSKLSCINELRACQFATKLMREHGFSVPRKITEFDNWYISFSLAQALNRGLKIIPPELRKYKKYLHEYDVHAINGKGKTKIVKRYRAIKRRLIT